MAATQTSAKQNNTPRVIKYTLGATAVGTDMATIDVRGVKRLFVHLTCAVATLTGFSVKAKATDSATAATLFSTSGHYTAPAGRLKGVSADLTTLVAGTGWIDLDVEGLESVSFSATSGGSATLAFDAGGV